MRSSDWSSDVCSSDLLRIVEQARQPLRQDGAVRVADEFYDWLIDRVVADEKIAARRVAFDHAAVGIEHRQDRKSVPEGKSGSVSVDVGGRRNIKKTNNNILKQKHKSKQENKHK